MDKWSGKGLYVGVIFGVLNALVIYFAFIRRLPKKREELKKFEFKGVFKPIFGFVICLIISISWTFAAIYLGMHFLYPTFSWLITMYMFFYWLAIKRLYASKKRS